MEAVRPSKTPVSYHITTRHNNPEDDLNPHHCQNLNLNSLCHIKLLKVCGNMKRNILLPFKKGTIKII
jgi:hypothetical protein